MGILSFASRSMSNATLRSKTVPATAPGAAPMAISARNGGVEQPDDQTCSPDNHRALPDRVGVYPRPETSPFRSLLTITEPDHLVRAAL